MAINNCVFEGTLGKDAEWRNGKNGKEFLTFNLGVQQGKNADGTYRDSLWLNCIANNVSDKLVEYLGKGQKVCVVGKLGVPTITQSKDGTKQYINVPFTVFEINLLASRGDEQPKAGEGKPVPGASRAAAQPTTAASDIPF